MILVTGVSYLVIETFRFSIHPSHLKIHLMNLFDISSVLFATACLAAQSHDQPKTDAVLSKFDGLKVKQHELFIQFLVTFEEWDIELAKAFTAGQVLGKHCVERNDMNSSNSSCSVGMKKNSVLLRFELDREVSTVTNSRVDMKCLQSVFYANMEWKFGCQTFKPFEDLFDLKEIKKRAKYFFNEFPSEVRYQFLKHAKTEIALIAIDVAILKWLVCAIKTKPQDCPFLFLNRDLIMAICSLSMHPTIEKSCKDDILNVLAHFEHFTQPANYSFFDKKYFIPSLITL